MENIWQNWTTYFNPRPPRGGRRQDATTEVQKGVFQSTPSARRATVGVTQWVIYWLFQSTPSARRATDSAQSADREDRISIHALREEGDFHDAQGISYLWISIHALREEGDIASTARFTAASHFNPRPPRGGRRLPWSRAILASIFQSTPSARRATRPARQHRQ